MNSSPQWHNYLAWRPVATVPIDNQVIRSRELKNTQKISEFLEGYSTRKYSCLVGEIQFVARLDGIFVVRFYLNDDGRRKIAEIPSLVQVLSKDIADAVKVELRHSHDFHHYPRIDKGPDAFLDFPSVPIDPTSLPEPGADSDALSHLVGIVSDDDILTALRAIPNARRREKRFVCLQLREHFARKRDLCIHVVKKFKENKAYRFFFRRFVFFSLIATVIVLVGSKLVPCVPPAWEGLQYAYSKVFTPNAPAPKIFPSFSGCAKFGQWNKSDFVILLTANLCWILLFGLYDMIRRGKPILRAYRHTAGCFAYANVYSKITENLYKNTTIGRKFQTETGNFDSVIMALKSLYEEEKEKLDANRNIQIALFSALVSVLIAVAVAPP